MKNAARECVAVVRRTSCVDEVPSASSLVLGTLYEVLQTGWDAGTSDVAARSRATIFSPALGALDVAQARCTRTAPETKGMLFGYVEHEILWRRAERCPWHHPGLVHSRLRPVADPVLEYVVQTDEFGGAERHGIVGGINRLQLALDVVRSQRAAGNIARKRIRR